jgi:hypothetical protein
MEIRFAISAIIFIGSYLPLSVILLAQDVDYRAIKSIFDEGLSHSVLGSALKNPDFSLLIFLLCGVCFVISLLSLRLANPKTPIQVKEAKYIPAELMNYTLPYVVSFMTFDYQETGKFIGLIVFLAWMFLITHRSGQVILNPLLIVFGWRHYEVKYQFSGSDKDFLGHGLSRDKIEQGDPCLQSSMQDIMIITLDEKRN